MTRMRDGKVVAPRRTRVFIWFLPESLKTISKKEVSSKIYESGILKPETEIMKETPWSRIR